MGLAEVAAVVVAAAAAATALVVAVVVVVMLVVVAKIDKTGPRGQHNSSPFNLFPELDCPKVDSGFQLIQGIDSISQQNHATCARTVRVGTQSRHKAQQRTKHTQRAQNVQTQIPTTEPPNHRTIEPSNHRTTEPPNHRPGSAR